MKKVVLMSMDTSVVEWSPAKYQLLDELKKSGFETYLFLPNTMKSRSNIAVDHMVNTRGMKNREICKRIIEINPQAVIATLFMDTAIIYWLPAVMKNTSFYYYNLEIYTPYISKEIRKENWKRYLDYKVRYPIDKCKEVIYTKSVKAFTIQDSLRKELSEKYHVRHANTILIPNSYTFDESLIVTPGQSGVIYSGGINREFLGKQFDELKTVQSVPVVFSGFIDQWCLQRIKRLKCSNPNLKFIHQNLPIKEYTDYLRNFAVGLVWYSALEADESHYCIGLSSGKMFKYLSLGQPVIAVDCPGITEVVNKYKLGIVIKSISELPQAYETIMKNYSNYRENVIKTYRSKFDFSKKITPFIEYIEKTMGG